ncbi:MAG: sigma-70 family RNA polymerase sigma factor [Actinomycetia bacterium]|nr:sigma-70 family RNA polymerase sigma factor [Actinomycetes bacterium]
MTFQPDPITPPQLLEILEITRLGAMGAGAKGTDIEDVCQTVAEKLVRKWNEPHIVAARSRDRGAWHAYVTVVARNTVKDLRRSDQRRRNRELLASDENTDEPLPDRPGIVRQAADEPSTTDALLARLVIADLIDERLDGRTREIALLTIVDCLTTNEIRDRLHLSVGTINSHKRRAFEQLRTAFGQDGSDDQKETDDGD